MYMYIEYIGCTYTSIYVHIHVHIHIYIYMYTCIVVCIYTYMCMSIDTYTYTRDTDYTYGLQEVQQPQHFGDLEQDQHLERFDLLVRERLSCWVLRLRQHSSEPGCLKSGLVSAITYSWGDGMSVYMWGCQ